MADVTLIHRAALAGARSGVFGARATHGGITLTPLPEGHVLHVLAASNTGDIAADLAQIGDGSPYAVRALGPGQWFVVGNTALSTADLAGKGAALAGKASIADQSHGRVRIGISGAFVEAVLAKGTAVDLALTQFAVGRSAMTLIGHISALITRTGNDGFELMALRGFAESLWDELIQMALEFGVDARPAASPATQL